MKDKPLSFRFDAKTVKAMDRLLTNPPSVVIDPAKGAPRSRTELLEVLIECAARKSQEEKASKA